MHKPNQPAPNPDVSDEPEGIVPGTERFDSGDHAGGHHPESRAEFPNLEPDTNSDYKQDVDLDLVLDIPVSMTMEVGATRLSIRNLLQLGRGSVVELDRLAGEPMDVKVNGVLVAHGEVVVVNEKFGIRLTNVIRPTEWIQKLK
ncbi:MAG: flagellar motor switch protein FliN [Gammaproteobacteria bacterium]